MEALWIPIITVISTAVAVILFFYFRAKTKAELQQTIRLSLEKGSELTPDLIEKMSVSGSSKVADLRKGIVLVGLGIACILAGLIVGDAREASAIGMFPLMLGFGFLTVWKLNKYE